MDNINKVTHSDHLVAPELSLVARGFSVDAKNKYIRKKILQLVNTARIHNDSPSKKN